MTDLMPAVVLNALRQYRFDGSPLWRMADGKDYVKIEVIFQISTNQHFDKKGTESKRRPTPPAGECPRLLTPARRPTTITRPTPARRPSTPCQEKETTPPLTQTVPATTRPHIKHDCKQKTSLDDQHLFHLLTAHRQRRKDKEINVDLPAFFLHQPWAKTWMFIKWPTSKYYAEDFYTAIEKKITTGVPQSNIISLFDLQERSCNDTEGKVPLHRLAREDS